MGDLGSAFLEVMLRNDPRSSLMKSAGDINQEKGHMFLKIVPFSVEGSI